MYIQQAEFIASILAGVAPVEPVIMIPCLSSLSEKLFPNMRELLCGCDTGARTSSYSYLYHKHSGKPLGDFSCTLAASQEHSIQRESNFSRKLRVTRNPRLLLQRYAAIYKHTAPVRGVCTAAI